MYKKEIIGLACVAILWSIQAPALSQRQLIKRNYALRLAHMRVTELPGHPLFFDAWAQTRKPDTKVLLLEYFVSTIIESIGIGARQSQIYPLVYEFRNFITDHQKEIPVMSRVHLEVQLQNLENMRWTNA